MRENYKSILHLITPTQYNNLSLWFGVEKLKWSLDFTSQEGARWIEETFLFSIVLCLMLVCYYSSYPYASERYAFKMYLCTLFCEHQNMDKSGLLDLQRNQVSWCCTILKTYIMSKFDYSWKAPTSLFICCFIKIVILYLFINYIEIRRHYLES